MSERQWSLETLLMEGIRVAIDSNVLIYLLEDDGPRAIVAGSIIDAVGAGRIVGIVASLGLTEVLAGFARHGDAARFETAAAELADLGLHVRALDAELAVDAAWLRAEGIGLEDAIHIATARAEDADVFVTNDRRIMSRARFEVAYLDDLVA